MDKETQEKVNRILDYIDKDRLVNQDPFFITRLLAKTEDYFSHKKKNTDLIPFWIRLRPALTIAIITLGIFIGIFSGSRLSMVNPRGSDSERNVLLEQYANESFINEVNSSIEEQLLSK
jgi:hypothetical protein